MMKVEVSQQCFHGPLVGHLSQGVYHVTLLLHRKHGVKE